MLFYDEFFFVYIFSFLDSYKLMVSRECRVMFRKDGFRFMWLFLGSVGGGVCDGLVLVRGKELWWCIGFLDVWSWV